MPWIHWPSHASLRFDDRLRRSADAYLGAELGNARPRPGPHRHVLGVEVATGYDHAVVEHRRPPVLDIRGVDVVRIEEFHDRVHRALLDGLEVLLPVELLEIDPVVVVHADFADARQRAEI